jgi:hypothetical protein
MRGDCVTRSYGFHLLSKAGRSRQKLQRLRCGSNSSWPRRRKDPSVRAPGHIPLFLSSTTFPQHHPLSYCASSTHPLLVDTLLRFESLRVAGVLDFCHWGSAASVLALRLSSGTFKISLQPNARALVLKSSRSSDVTAQAHPQLAQSVGPCGGEVVAPPTTNGHQRSLLLSPAKGRSQMCTKLLLRGKARAVTNILQSLLAHPPHYILLTNIGVSLSHGFDQ